MAAGFETVVGGLRAAAEPTRLRLLALCAQAELTVSELTEILGQSQPRVSRHLKLLCEGGLLVRAREGTNAFYRAATEGAAAAASSNRSRSRARYTDRRIRRRTSPTTSICIGGVNSNSTG